MSMKVSHTFFKNRCLKYGQTVTITYKGAPDTSHDEFGFPDPDFDRYPNKYSVDVKAFVQPPRSDLDRIPDESEIGEVVSEEYRLYAPYDVQLDGVHTLKYDGGFWEIGDVDSYKINDQVIYRRAYLKRLSTSPGEGNPLGVGS